MGLSRGMRTLTLALCLCLGSCTNGITAPETERRKRDQVCYVEVIENRLVVSCYYLDDPLRDRE